MHDLVKLYATKNHCQNVIFTRPIKSKNKHQMNVTIDECMLNGFAISLTDAPSML